MVPTRGVLAEIARGPLLSLALHRVEALQIALELRVAEMHAGHEPLHEIALDVGIGETEIGPGPLLITPDQPGLEQELQMPRNPWLRLIEDFGKVGNGEIAARQQCKNAQSAGFSGRLQCINHHIQRRMRSEGHSNLQQI